MPERPKDAEVEKQKEDKSKKMMLEENGLIGTSSSSASASDNLRNGSGRRFRPPPADFAPFDSSETRVKRRNGHRPDRNGSEDGKVSLKRSSLMTWHDIPGKPFKLGLG